MFGIEEAYCNAMVSGLIKANQALLDTTVEEAIAASYVPFKGDTLGIDQIPENTIANVLTEFDQYAVLITEERGEDANPLSRHTALTVRGPRTFFVCDPCDRSSPLCAYLRNHKRDARRVADVLMKKNAKENWEKAHSGPCSITGANAAITCVRRGLPICSALLNYITQEIIIACSAGIFHASLFDHDDANKLTLDSMNRTRHLSFPYVNRASYKNFVTFVGKPERGYPQNLALTKLSKEDDLKQHLHYDQPGGPTRILYLTNQQAEQKTMGFILANGEKIGEWIHWLPFIRFAKREEDRGAEALHLFEITQDQSSLRDGYLMTPTEPYSVFKEVVEGRVVINVDKLGDFDNPSKYRATLLVVPASNDWAIGRAQQYGYRELKFYGD